MINNPMVLKRSILILLLILSLGQLRASNSTHTYENWAFGFHFGVTSFFGDLSDVSGGLRSTPFSKYFYQDLRTMGGISLKKWFTPHIGVRGYMGYGKLQGTKESSNAWFEANVFNYHIEAIADLTNIFFGVDRRRPFSISAFVGIGFTESRTWKYSMTDGSLIGTNGFGKPLKPGGDYIPMTETIVPTGIIANFFVSNKISLYVEGSFHPINSDKLDATPNENPSFVTSLEGYNYFGVGMEIWFGSGGNKLFRGRGGARYSTRRGTSINKRIFKRNTRAVFKRSKSRFRFKRSRR